MKRFFSVMLVMCLVFLTSCSANASDSALTVNSTAEISGEVFTYFLDKAHYATENITDSDCISNATAMCLQYLAVNSKYAEMGMTLTQDEKASIAKETNSLWRVYGEYYTEMGVSKETFYKIRQYEHCKEDLRFALYDTDGINALPEDYIKQYFKENYVGIKYFYEDLYKQYSDDEVAAMTSEELSALASSKTSAEERYKYISTLATYVNSSIYSIDEAYMATTGEVSADVEIKTTVVAKSGSGFTSDFVNAVFNQNEGSAFLITNAEHSYVYFVQRVNLMADEYGFYDDYRDECLVAVSENYLINEINTWAQSYSAVRHTSVVNKCLENVKGVDRSKFVGTDKYVFDSFHEEV